MDITLNIKKASVYDDVAKLTGYIGAKNNESELTYDKVFTTDDDRILLERFWRDSCNASTDEFKNFIKTVSESTSQTIDNTEIYTVVMTMPSSFDIKELGLIRFYFMYLWFFVKGGYRRANPFELEAYAHDDDLGYLKQRERYAWESFID